MLHKELKTKILLDSGDPHETVRVRSLLGFIDGQTTNPSLIAMNPEVRRRVASGQRFSLAGQRENYKAIVQQISPLVGDAGVSIEVLADLRTTCDQMLAQGKEMFSWIPNAYIKYPCTYEGLRATQQSVQLGIRVNITLCFSQEQAAGVYAATQTSGAPVYISPFIGRLDDSGVNGIDLIKNIQRMYQEGDGHVSILGASIRTVDHLLACLASGAELVTVPSHVLEAWAAKGFPLPDQAFDYHPIGRDGGTLRSLPYKDLKLHKPWNAFNLRHDLTRKGIEKFTADFNKTLQPPENDAVIESAAQAGAATR